MKVLTATLSPHTTNTGTSKGTKEMSVCVSFSMFEHRFEWRVLPEFCVHCSQWKNPSMTM